MTQLELNMLIPFVDQLLTFACDVIAADRTIGTPTVGANFKLVLLLQEQVPLHIIINSLKPDLIDDQLLFF